MSILITGGTGAIGSALARHLVLDRGLEGVVLFDLHPDVSRVRDVLDRVVVERGDVLEAHDLLRVIARHRIDRIVHLAFLLGSGDPEPDAAVPYLRALTEGAASVFEAARIAGIKRVVVASSSAVFGYPGDHGKPLTYAALEDDPKRPRSTYGWSKLWGEGIAEWFNRVHGMEILNLRVCHTFGNGMPNSLAAGLTSRRNPVFTMAPELIEAGLPVTLPPDDQIVDFLYIADTAAAFATAVTGPLPEHRVFNLRAEQRPVGEFTAQLRRLYPDADITVEREARGGQLQVMDNARVVADLGFRAAYTVETALEEYARVARQRQRARVSA